MHRAEHGKANEQPDDDLVQDVDVILPYVVKIRTPGGWGTGFFLNVDPARPYWTIATANHVIVDADEWEQPIRVEHQPSGKSLILHPHERVVYRDPKRDTAMIVFGETEIPLPSQPLQMIPPKKFLKRGNELAWIGYPVVGEDEACFFNGHCSAWLHGREIYLVDGVAINGVSGGPAFHMNPDGSPTVLGVVSAYRPNQATGVTLPGLAMISGIAHFHEIGTQFKDLADAQERAEAEEAERKANEPKSEEEPPQKTCVNV